MGQMSEQDGTLEERALEGTLRLEPALEQTLGLEPTVCTSAYSSSGSQGLSKPQMAGFTGDRLTGWMAGWFWLGTGHSPDTGGSPPSSIVPWCLGGPRGDGSDDPVLEQ